MTDQSPPTTIEGLPGRIPFSAGGVIFFLVLMLFNRIRSSIHENAVVITDTTFQTVLLNGLILLLLTPFIHQIIHLMVSVAAGEGVNINWQLLFPRVRPKNPISRTMGIWFFLAPVLLTVVCMLCLFIKPLAGSAAFIGALNLGLSVNDIWKLIGFNKVPKFAQILIHASYCEVLPIK